MSSKESGRRLGIDIEYIRFADTDISASVMGINVYEGLRDGFIEVDIVFADEFSFIHEIDMSVLNEVEISFVEIGGNRDIQGDSYKLNLIANSIMDYGRQPNQNFDSYTIRCLSKSAIINERICVSRSYKTTTISTIVDSMLTLLKYDGKRDIRPTAYSRDLIVPFLCPLDVISWLLKHAVSNDTNAGDYVFYEDIKGVHFVPFNSLVDGKRPVRKYYLTSGALETADSDFDLTLDKIVVEKVQDIFEDIEADSEMVTVCEHDIERGVQKVVSVTDRKSIIDSNKTYDLGLTNIHDKQITVPNTGFYKAIKEQSEPKFAKGLINKGRIQRTFASIELPGENIIVPGALIELVHFNDIVEEDNPIYSGIWLVDKVKRIVTSQGYVIHADIISDKIIGSGL